MNPYVFYAQDLHSLDIKIKQINIQAYETENNIHLDERQQQRIKIILKNSQWKIQDLIQVKARVVLP